MEWAIYHNSSRCTGFFSVKKEVRDKLNEILEEKKSKKITIKEGLNSFVAVSYDETGEIIIDLYEIDRVY